MAQLKFKAKEFKKMVDPNNSNSKRIKYVCYVQADSIPQEMDDWMGTNPREQKMTTNVAVKIKNSLDGNENFHELNRGILVSADSVQWHNVTEDLVITFTDSEVHGNIDGGHTLRAILESKNKNTLLSNRYVFFEIIVGLTSPVELAAARNTSVQVDLKSIAELENSFLVVKEAFKNVSFCKRIQFKMNEHYNDEDISPIDVREIIAILIMFSQEIYPYKNAYGVLSDVQPVQCYSGKEASLKKFLKCNLPDDNPEEQKQRREKMVESMAGIIPDIFKLYELIETTFAETSTQIGKRYGSRKYSKFDDKKKVGESFFGQADLQYIVPKGLMYPIVGSFRSLVVVDKGEYKWKQNPLEVWDKLGPKLVARTLDEKIENPDVLAKNTNLWSNLFKDVYIYAYL